MSDCPKCLGIPSYFAHTCDKGAPDMPEEISIDIKLAANIVKDIEVLAKVFKFHVPASIDRIETILNNRKT